MMALIACEYSARVRDAFRGRGHDAFSLDILPTDGDPRYHIQAPLDAEVLSWGWDLIIAFPPCTYLTNSNAWRWDAIADERVEALNFVQMIMNAPCGKIAVENPVGAIGTAIRKADQYVQPWHFGEPWQKTTGLWLKGLPLLKPEVSVKPDDVRPWVQAGYGPRISGKSRTSDGVARNGKLRSATFLGIARAMSEQWG